MNFTFNYFKHIFYLPSPIFSILFSFLLFFSILFFVCVDNLFYGFTCFFFSSLIYSLSIFLDGVSLFINHFFTLLLSTNLYLLIKLSILFSKYSFFFSFHSYLLSLFSFLSLSNFFYFYTNYSHLISDFFSFLPTCPFSFTSFFNSISFLWLNTSISLSLPSYIK